MERNMFQYVMLSVLPKYTLRCCHGAISMNPIARLETRDITAGIHWAPLSSLLSTYGCIFISPLHIINSASSPESLWLHVSWGPLDLAGSYAMALLMPRPLLLSTSICLMDHGGLGRGPCLLPTIHTLCYVHWMCCNSVMIPSLHMTSLASVHPGEGSSSVALLNISSLFSLWKGFFYFLGVFPDLMCGPWTGMSCRVCVQILKPFEANL